jgi:hypothetical protein
MTVPLPCKLRGASLEQNTSLGIPWAGKTCPALSRGVSHGPRSIKLCTFAYKFISNLHHLHANAPTRYPPSPFTHFFTRPPCHQKHYQKHPQKHIPLRIYSLNSGQLQTFITNLLNANQSRQQEHFYPRLSPKSRTHSTTLGGRVLGAMAFK